jgi:hypothetical protein
MKEKKARVEDALHATRAAVEEGIVPAAAWPCCAACPPRSRQASNEDEQIGVGHRQARHRRAAARAGDQRRRGRLRHRAGSQEAQGQRRLQRRHRRIRRPRQSRRRGPEEGHPQRAAERGVHRRPAADHRMPHHRAAGEGKAGSGPGGGHGGGGMGGMASLSSRRSPSPTPNRRSPAIRSRGDDTSPDFPGIGEKRRGWCMPKTGRRHS